MPPPSVRQQQWDRRADNSLKGNGFLGVLVRPDGGVSSEISVAESEQLKDAKGEYLEYPTLVPTLTASEVQTLLHWQKGQDIPEPILRKAEAFALVRHAQGLPLFAQPGEEAAWIHPQFPRAAVQQLSGDVSLPNETGRIDPRLSPNRYGSLIGGR